jgi:hypothetical protein
MLAPLIATARKLRQRPQVFSEPRPEHAAVEDGDVGSILGELRRPGVLLLNSASAFNRAPIGLL